MRLTTRETAVFGMLGAVLYASKMVMEVLPNIHLLGTLIVAITLVYRKKALYPIYTFVLLCGLFSGFALWWPPYLYVWAVLWGAVMLLPRDLPPKWRAPVYMCVSALHGFLYGILYAPSQALLFGLNLESTVAWVMTGLPWDFVHGMSNFCFGILICPLAAVLQRAERHTGS